ncbi:hypothetical protein C0995_000946 [Termitomyces sp. Mi166|nr:hypothetical protein C0995_000946 [Termitomyces sp. Mi166\
MIDIRITWRWLQPSSEGLNLSGGLFEQAAVHEVGLKLGINLWVLSLFLYPLHDTPQAPLVPIKKDVYSEYMLSYVNKPDVGTAPEQAHLEFKQDQPSHINFQHERPPHLDCFSHSEPDKPHTFTSNQAWVAYLQGIALDHYTVILCFNPSHPLFTNWQVFVNKFSSKFKVFDTVAEAKRKLMSFRMSTDKCFIAFIVQFKKEAYKTGWNYNALRFQLSEALLKHIHDVLQFALKQPTYESFKNLITQIDQCYWKDPSALLAMH